MPAARRHIASTAALLLALLVGCGAQPTPSPTLDPAAAAAAAAAARDAYNAAICPIFEGIAALDPRLAGLRAMGAGSDPAAIDLEQVNAVSRELATALDGLAAVPDWEPGRNLRYQVIAAVHAVRARLLIISEDALSQRSLDRLAELPFMASLPLDRAMNQAVAAGHICILGSPSS